MRVSRGRTYTISDITIDADIAMATYKLTGLGAPAAQNDSLRYGQAEIRNDEIAVGAAIALAKLASQPWSVLTIAKTEVFSGNSPNPSAWTDLNINAVVGANVALVILAVKCADGSYLAVRQNGDTDEYFRAHTAAFGAGFLAGSTNVYAVLVVPTNASGVIEWKAQTVDSPVVINVIAYLK